MDVSADERIVVGDVCTWDDVCALDGEAADPIMSHEPEDRDRRYLPAERVRCDQVVSQLDEECALADVGGHALQLERLEPGPPQKGRVCGDKLAEILDESLVGSSWLFCSCDLAGGVLADLLM